jgi:hypothetical protein
VDRLRCSVTQIISLQAYQAPPRWRSLANHHPAQSCCRAIKTRATKRSIAFLAAEATSFRHNGIFSVLGALSIETSGMLELWNNWYETLASMEALATVIVIVVVAAGVITLAESRRR